METGHAAVPDWCTRFTIASLCLSVLVSSFAAAVHGAGAWFAWQAVRELQPPFPFAFAYTPKPRSWFVSLSAWVTSWLQAGQPAYSTVPLPVSYRRLALAPPSIRVPSASRNANTRHRYPGFGHTEVGHLRSTLPVASLDAFMNPASPLSPAQPVASAPPDADMFSRFLSSLTSSSVARAASPMPASIV